MFRYIPFLNILLQSSVPLLDIVGSIISQVEITENEVI